MTNLTPEFLALLDQADGALDRDTHEQVSKEELDLPDDAEIWIRAATRQKINRVFRALDAMRKAPAAAVGKLDYSDVKAKLADLHKRAKAISGDGFQLPPSFWMSDRPFEFTIWVSGRKNHLCGSGATVQKAYEAAIDALAEHDPALIDKTLGLDLLREGRP